MARSVERQSRGRGDAERDSGTERDSRRGSRNPDGAGTNGAGTNGEQRDHKDREATDDPDRAHRAPSRSRLSGSEAVRRAKEHLLELTGQVPESISGLSRSPEGWSVTVEVVEMERIPQTTDVMGSFRVEIDGDGELAGCTRVRRYYRNQAGEE